MIYKFDNGEQQFVIVGKEDDIKAFEKEYNEALAYIERLYMSKTMTQGMYTEARYDRLDELLKKYNLEYGVPKHISAEEAAEFLSISRARISVLIKEGRLEADEKGITYTSAARYKKTRKNGRPLNSFRKH